MKEIKIKFQDKDEFIIFQKDLKEALETIENFKIINNENEEEVTIKFKGIIDLYPISMYFLYRYIEEEFNIEEKTENDEILIEKLYELMKDNDYLASLISLKIYKYTLFNNFLDEKLFFKYNLRALYKELSLYLDSAVKKIESEYFKEDLLKIIESNGVKVSDYEELRVKYIDNELNLINKKNKNINSKNIKDIFGLPLPSEEDEWVQDIVLCMIVCSTLKVKEITIPKEYTPLYETLIENKSALGENINIILEE